MFQEPVYGVAMAEPGLCGKCGKSTDCLNTSHGWMCRPCFQDALNVPQTQGTRLYTMPEPGQKVFVVMEPPNVFITVSGTLYAFERKQDADDLALGLRKAYGVHRAYVREVEATEALKYVLSRPELKLIGVKETVMGKPDAGPGEVQMPPL